MRNFAALLVLLAGLPSTHATSILSGEVTFDSQSSLYTYTYTLDTTALTSNTIEVGVLQNVALNYGPPPVSHTQPSSDWIFATSGGGLQNSGDSNIFGSFWQWTHNYFAPSASNTGLLVFSVTTTRGANTSPANNYFIFDGGATTGPAENPGFFEVGHIVGPEFVNIPLPPVSSVPEPQAYPMLVAGLALLGLLSSRRLRVSPTLSGSGGA